MAEQQTSDEGTVEREAKSRRGLMKAAGAAAAGAVVAVAIPGRAEAAEGGNMLIGGANVGTSDTTISTTGAIGATNVFTSTDDSTLSLRPSALGGFAYGTSVHNGVYGFSNSRLTGASGYGVIAAVGGDGRAPLYVADSDNPLTSSFSHERGEIVHDAGNMYVCVAAGTPGTWRRIAGPSTAGSFHAIDPIRVFDSRAAGYGAQSGIVAADSSRVIPVHDARDNAGNVTATNAIPVGATAVAMNLTVTGATSAGFASVTPGDSGAFTASSINFQGGADIANAFPSKLDSNRQIKVWMGPGTSAHVIVDVQGYYL